MRVLRLGGSKDPNNRRLGPKKTHELGPWTLRVIR